MSILFHNLVDDILLILYSYNIFLNFILFLLLLMYLFLLLLFVVLATNFSLYPLIEFSIVTREL